MHTHRRAAIFVGILFTIASVTAVLAKFVFYPPLLTSPDYLTNGAAHASQVVLGVLMDLTLAVTAIGTAVGLFPVLRPYGERIALGHLCFRFLEAVVITVGVVAVLSLVTLSQDFVAAATPDASAYHTAGTLLLAVYNWTFMLGPLFFLGVNTLLYSYLLYTSRLVPRSLAAMGMTGALLVFGFALLVMFGVTDATSSPWVLLATPVGVYEMILAGWLIVKGFNPAAVASAPARTGTNAVLRPA